MKVNLDGTTLICWGSILAAIILTVVILPPIGIIMWSVIGIFSLLLWGIEKIGVTLENRKKGQ